MKFNLVLFRPNGNSSVNCFRETMLAMEHALRDLGHEVTVQENVMRQDALNILYGYNVAEWQNGYRKFKYVIHQLEQLSDTEGWMTWRQGNNMRAFFRHAMCIIDYSIHNLKYLKTRFSATPSMLIKHGYHPVLEDIAHTPLKDIDVSFVGAYAPRREAILDKAIKPLGLRTFHWGRNLWAKERAKVFSRSKITLNLHAYEMNIQESARLSYLWSNKLAVLSEVCRYDEYPLVPQIYVPKDEIGSKLKELLDGAFDINDYGMKCYEAFKTNYRLTDMVGPMIEILKKEE